MLRNVILQMKEKPTAVPLPMKCVNFLREHKVSTNIANDLARSSFAEWIAVGPLQLLPMPELVEQNTSISACIEHGFLVLASGANGDPVAVDLESLRMVYINHELLGFGEEPFAAIVHQTPFFYDEFWEAAASDESFPWDYFEAKRRWPFGEAGGLRIVRPED